MYDYIIIGGGISGVACARMLQLAGVKDFLILEAQSEPGGLCRTRQIGGHVLDIGGGHFLCTKYKEVYDFIFRHIPESEFNRFHRVSKIELHGQYVDYPLESAISQFSSECCADYLISIARNGEFRGDAEPTTFEEWIRWKLGNKIADEYMLPYNIKLWGLAPNRMDIDWLHKIPSVDVKKVFVQALSRELDRGLMPSHQEFYYPRYGGFQRIFDALLAPVASSLRTEMPVTKIEREGDAVVVNGSLRARRVINTAPWRQLVESPIFSNAGRAAIKKLKNTSLVVSLREEDYEHDMHWLYQPDTALARHRTFFINNFAPNSQKNGVYDETNATRWVSYDEIYANVNDYAYPIPAIGWAKDIKIVVEEARMNNVYSLGRWGQWQYFNSDVCIKEAMNLADELGHPGWRNTSTAF